MVRIYSVNQGDEDNSDGNDQAGTRAYPSRTFIGVKASLGEKHSWVLEPLKLFWGLVVIPEYMYRFKLPVAKTELMALDLPRVDYNSDKKKGKDITNINENDRSIKLNEESIRKMQEKRKTQQDQWQEVNLNELTSLHVNE